MNLRWWQVLLFFVLFAAVIYFKVVRSEKLDAREIERTLEAHRKDACACHDESCAALVRSQLERYLAEIDGTEVYDKKLGYLERTIEAAYRCLASPQPAAPILDLGAALAP
jgi:hypothetical protein